MLASRTRYWVQLIGVVVACVAILIVLLNSFSNFDLFLRWGSQRPSIVSMTAFSFALIGIALITSDMSTPLDRVVFTVAVVWVMTVSLARIAMAIVMPEHDFESLLGLNTTGDRMAIGTSLGLMSVSVNLMIVIMGPLRQLIIARGLSVLCVLTTIAVGVLQVYHIEIPGLYVVYQHVSLPTLALFSLSVVGLVLLSFGENR